MSNFAIRVEGLGKRYRIGKSQPKPTGRKPVWQAMALPLGYLMSTLRKPSRDEIIWALKDVSFEIKRGEAWGVIGRNGAGKSTLLKILSRITEPTEGYSRIRGKVGSLLEVGSGFHPELTGRENVYLNGAIIGMKKAEVDRKFDEIVAFAGIEKFIDTPVKRYSSGMYVRLAFAVAAHLESEILLMDEVLAVGDAAFQKRCLGKMGDAAKAGRTVLFVSHNMAAISQLCTQTIWLNSGQVEMNGPSGQVVQAYMSASSRHRPERQWLYPGDAPGDDRVRLLACRILQGGQVTEVIDINQACQIEIDFQVLQPAHNLISGVNLYNEEGICLFDSCDWRPNQFIPARYRKHVEIPAQVLAEGTISVLVQLVFYDPDIQSVVLRDVLQVDTVDSDHPRAVRGQYKGAWPGVVRIGLSWSEAKPISNRQPGDD